VRKPEYVLRNIWRSDAPKNKNELRKLWEDGFTDIFCFQEGWSWLFGAFRGESYWESLGGNYVRIPVSNFFGMSIDQVRLVADQILAAESGKVLIHCRAGVDRTGFMCGYLLWREHIKTVCSAWNYVVDRGMHAHYQVLWKKRFFELCRRTK
jgi:protein tyrosine phosphatase (PTP) superfamily phosphohydrolase (DUF442 family)